MLYPRESETRQVKDLNGLWRFRTDHRNEGFSQKWFSRPLPDTILMPVPASYNDITQDASLRDHVGWVWYETTLFAPERWLGQSVLLRFGSATHHAVAWVNGHEVVAHRGGYMPFEAEIAEHLLFGRGNRITVAVSNVLDWTTIPPGQVKTPAAGPRYPSGFTFQETYQDFFNYAGLHRPVRVVVRPRRHIQDIAVNTGLQGRDGRVSYSVALSGTTGNVRVRLLDEKGKVVARGNGKEGTLRVRNARLWFPGKAYLYTLEVSSCAGNRVEDIYRQPVGIRTIKVTGKQFRINGKRFYFKGFGKHEDADLRGRGHDDVTNMKDFNLLKWIGANSFRTSHYPYSEEIMELADRVGVAVIDETPAVGLNYFPHGKTFQPDRVGRASQAHLLQVIREMVARDRNHPCVVMWSVANEAATDETESVPYFRPCFELFRTLDPTRPVTIVTCYDPNTCLCTQMADVVCVNRYYSWYNDPGRLDLVGHQLAHNLRAWHRKFRRPVVVTEYGADAVAGLHADPPVMFSEEYQVEMLELFHKVFDRLDFMAGEHVWNFADFMTRQEIRRVVGNRKGVFTRERQPKMIAHALRKRWTGLK